MTDLVYYQTSLLFFDIPLLYYYTTLRSSIIFYLSSGVIYLSLGVSLSCSFVIVSELFCGELETFVTLLAILLPITPPATSAVELLFLKIAQSNLEHLIQNMIHQVISNLHSMSELIF